MRPATRAGTVKFTPPEAKPAVLLKHSRGASHHSNRLLVIAINVVMAGMLASRVAAQGKLDTFEADVAAREDHRRTHGESSDRCLSSLWEALFSDLFEITLLYGGACSWARVTDAEVSADGAAPRALGEPLIPFARVDVSYQNVESDVDAVDAQADLGYGPVGAHLGFTRYREQTPADHLDMIRALGLYRMSFGSHIETDLGLGGLTLKGEQTTRKFLFSLPVLVHPSEHWGIEFRPAWADRISDYDVALLLTRRFASAKLGYRWVDSPHESLDGPYIGISIRL